MRDVLIITSHFGEEKKNDVLSRLSSLLDRGNLKRKAVFISSPFYSEICELFENRGASIISLKTNTSDAYRLSQLFAVWDGVSEEIPLAARTARKAGARIFFDLLPGNVFSIWSVLGSADAVCVTTNGFVTQKGKAVMGRGVALQVQLWLPDAEVLLGRFLLKFGNRPAVLGNVEGTSVVSFPVKAVKDFWPCPVVQHAPKLLGQLFDGMEVPGFLLKADPDIIRRSADDLARMIEKNNWKSVYLPKPGCGAGELSEEEALSALAQSDLKEVADKIFIADTEGAVPLRRLLVSETRGLAF